MKKLDEAKKYDELYAKYRNEIGGNDEYKDEMISYLRESDAVRQTRGKNVYYVDKDNKAILYARTCYGVLCDGVMSVSTAFTTSTNGKGSKTTECTACIAEKQRIARAKQATNAEMVGELGSVGGNPLQEYDFMGETIRIHVENGVPMFVGKDVTDLLGYVQAVYAIKEHLETDDYELLSVQTQSQKNGKLHATPSLFITESGLYELTLMSSKPEATPFRRWITREVIPSIRRTGGYVAPNKAEMFVDTVLGGATMTAEARATMITTVEASMKAQADLATANQHIEVIEPKAVEYDRFMGGDGLITITSVAQDRGLSGQSLNNFLKVNGVQYKQHDRWYLYSEHSNKGYTRIRRSTRPDGHVVESMQWTPLGVQFVNDLLDKANSI